MKTGEDQQWKFHMNSERLPPPVVEMERLSVDNISFLARNSMSLSPKRASQVSLLAEAQSDSIHHLDDRNWSWAYLRNRFSLDEMEELYDRYYLRIQNSYFNVYLVMQVVLSFVYILILLAFSFAHDDRMDRYPELKCPNSNANKSRTLHDRCVESAVLQALPEMTAHAIILVACAIMYMLVSDEKLFKHQTHGRTIQIALSIVTCFSVLIPDIGLSVYYYFQIEEIRTPLAFPTIILVYFFLPLPKKYHAVILGLVVSALHLIASGLMHIFDTAHHDYEESWPRRVFAEMIYYLCGNAVGVYSQLMNEVTLRRAFLDRRGYIKSTIKKNYEKDQEEYLLSSILPDHISKLVKEELRNAIREYGEEQHSRKRSSNVSNGSSLSQGTGSTDRSPQNPGVIHKKPFSDLFVERHENVSILFADIVNFTPLTVKLKADELVETLNELFGRFDAAATRHHCVRIKLLGDCYYAVSGLQNQQTPDHAKNCVRLGFDMIEIIKEVRDALKVDLNMRIGIHSGSILSGLLGIYKWQYDIWSKDVTIANHMEQSGLPGRVHITEQTKEYLGAEFAHYCKPANGKQRDKYLEENNIETFFLTPPRTSWKSSSPSSPVQSYPTSDLNDSHEDEDTDVLGDLSSPKSLYARGYTNYTVGAAITPRRSSTVVDLIRKKSVRVGSFVAGSSDVLRYREMMGQVNETMKQAIDEMPIRKLDVYCHGRSKPNHEHKNSINIHVNPILMNFDELQSEIHYQTQPDPLFKYYVGCALFVLLCIGVLQIIAVPQQHSVLWFILAIGCTFLVILTPFVWVGYLWTQIKDPHRELDVIPLPQNKLVRLLFHSSNRITGSFTRRTILYFCIAVVISFFAIIDVAECDCDKEDCKSPWYYTYSCALAILLTYTFFRIHFLLKVAICAIALVAYSFTISVFKKCVFEQHHGGSPGLGAVDHEDFSHIIYLMGIGAMLHIMDRQMEYINRLDFIWKKRLTEEHKEASLTHAVNTVLIHNILPTQIAKIYLDPYRMNESHGRTYHNVSVMFASIPHFMDVFTEGDLSKNGLKGLQILNQIITEFDKALFNYIDLEKIKVTGSTFMAACGLEVQETGRLSATSMVPAESEYSSSWKENERLKSVENPLKRQKTLLTLVKFASDMMVRLQNVNLDKGLDFHLRVGIDTGQVVAGVIGSQKPLYDIWGDTVNLASRMDSHGTPDKIQVSYDCANLLMQAHVRCEKRGSIYIKGKPTKMTTYYVVTDEEFRILYDYDFDTFETDHSTDL